VKEGIPSALISFPLRYMHSVVEMADLRDVEKTIELIARFVESVTDDDDFVHKL
jgi:putative aminopeptidase FrvX